MRNVGVCQSSFIQLTTPCIISGHLHSLDALNDTLLISGCGLRAVTDRERCFLALNDSNQPVFCIRVFFLFHLQRGRILNILIKSVSEFNLIMSSPYALLTPDTDPSPVGGVGGVGGSAHLIHLLDGPTVPHHMGPNTHTHTHTLQKTFQPWSALTVTLSRQQKHLISLMVGVTPHHQHLHPSLQALGFLITPDQGHWFFKCHWGWCMSTD